MHRRIALSAIALSAVVVAGTACAWRSQRGTLPERLSDEEFWRLSTSLSEPAGAFIHSENLVSNELFFIHTVRQLRPRGGSYIGVGPEQNFSFVARLRPAIAFIIDIRQENRNLHLLYKALFELSTDRADFVSRLFSRERPPGLDSRTSVRVLFAAFAAATPSRGLHDATRQLVRERLLDGHRLPLTPDDLASIDRAFDAFLSDGPEIHYSRARSDSEPSPSYRALMTAVDVGGQSRSYLATEEAFGFIKDLQARNLVVPVVGDFGGPGAIRRVGEHVRQQGSRVSAFYASNVEVYLSKQQTAAFCASLAALPIESSSWFIGNRGLQPLSTKIRNCSPVRR